MVNVMNWHCYLPQVDYCFILLRYCIAVILTCGDMQFPKERWQCWNDASNNAG